MKRLWIKLHSEASGDLRNIIKYCRESFGANVAREVRAKIIKNTSLLMGNPYLGKVEPLLNGCNSLEYRSLLVSEHTKLIYTVHTDYVYVHLLWDVRQDERNLKKQTVYRYMTTDPSILANDPVTEYGKTE